MSQTCAHAHPQICCNCSQKRQSKNIAQNDLDWTVKSQKKFSAVSASNSINLSNIAKVNISVPLIDQLGGWEWNFMVLW
jgi:hypothetical protein